MKSFNVFLTEASIPQFKFNGGAKNVVKGLEQLGSNDPKKDALKVMEARRLTALFNHLKDKSQDVPKFTKEAESIRQACGKELVKMGLPADKLKYIGHDARDYALSNDAWVELFNNMDLGIKITKQQLPLLMGKTYSKGNMVAMDYGNKGDNPGKGGLGEVETWVMNSKLVDPKWKNKSNNLGPGKNPSASNFMN